MKEEELSEGDKKKVKRATTILYVAMGVFIVLPWLVYWFWKG